MSTIIIIIVILAVIFIPLIVLGLYAASQYNKLVKLDQQYENAFKQIDVQLQNRHEMIPQLLGAVKGYLDHEAEIFDKITSARQKAEEARQKAADNPGDSKAMKELVAAEQLLENQMSGLQIQVEDTPELKGNENVMRFQEDLKTTQEKLTFARQSYNDSVMRYNTARNSFPTVIFAGLFNFGEAEYFELEDPAAREVPEISFD